MYTEFYNLREKPFILNASSRFLYLGEAHKEALALLKYGVMERKGFILLTGEVGTGKTTMVRTLLDSLKGGVRYVHLSNPLLSAKEFIDYLAFSAFKKWIQFKSKAQFLIIFEAFLRECLRDQENFNVIIDEAHKLSFDLLEEIRLLSNMETGDQKLVNIFLVGQPELNEKLREPRCRPLLQRIAVRYHIPPLGLKETGEYMATRLKAAGGKGIDDIFPKSAVKRIYRYSNGYPRLINILGDNALLLGYSRGLKRITPSMVKACYEDMRLESFRPKSGARKSKSPEMGPHPRRWYWRWTLIVLLMMVITVFVALRQGKDFLSGLTFFIPERLQSLSFTAFRERILWKNQIKDKAVQGRTGESLETEKRSLGELGKEDEQSGMKSVFYEDNPDSSFQQDELPDRIIMVREGDTLKELVHRNYGRHDYEIMRLIQKSNPGLKNIDKIVPGQKIIFPSLRASKLRKE